MGQRPNPYKKSPDRILVDCSPELKEEWRTTCNNLGLMHQRVMLALVRYWLSLPYNKKIQLVFQDTTKGNMKPAGEWNDVGFKLRPNAKRDRSPQTS